MRKSNLTKKVSIESSFSANDLAILFQVSLLTLIIEGFFSLNAALSPLREAQESIRSPRSSTGSQRSHASECSNSSRLDSSSDSRNSAKDLNSNSPYPRPPLIENEKIASHLGNFGISPNRFLFWLPGTCKSQPNPKPAGMNTIWKCREDRFLTRFPDPRRMAMLWSVCPSRSPMSSWDIPVPIIFMSWKSWKSTVPCEPEVKNQCWKQGHCPSSVPPPPCDHYHLPWSYTDHDFNHITTITVFKISSPSSDSDCQFDVHLYLHLKGVSFISCSSTQHFLHLHSPLSLESSLSWSPLPSWSSSARLWFCAHSCGIASPYNRLAMWLFVVNLGESQASFLATSSSLSKMFQG